MMNKALISILMPVYNSMDIARSGGHKLLPLSLDSLLNQSYKNIELLIIDNQSTDETSEICKSYAAKDSRVKYILDTKKRWPDEAANYAANIMRGQYCMFACDDDLWHPEFISKLTDNLIKHPEIDMIYSNGKYIDIAGKKKKNIIMSKEDTYDDKVSSFTNYCKYIIKRNVLPIIFGIYKTESIKLIPFEIFDKWDANVDNLFISSFFLSGRKCLFLDEELFYYRNKKRGLEVGASNHGDMPDISNPLLVWVYYVRHQLYFFLNLKNKINKTESNDYQKIYLINFTFHSFVKHSINLLNWIDASYIRNENDKNIYFKLRDFYDKNIKEFIIGEHALSRFQDDDCENIRFMPEIISAHTNASLLICSAFEQLVNMLGNLANEKSGLIGAVIELLKNEENALEKNKINVDAKLNCNFVSILKNANLNLFPYNAGGNNPKLSIISCSKNLGRYLEDTIISINRQSYRDFEHIVIDANSTDETVSILKRYPHVKWISENDFGYTDAFRKGLSIAKGKYIMSCCVSDGYINNDWFKKCVEFLDEHPEISLVWGFPQYLTEEGILKNISYPEFHLKLPPQREKWLIYWLITSFHFPEGNFCVRKEVIDKCFPLKDRLEVDSYLEFNCKFNIEGYLPYHIPVVANFGRTHKDQQGQVEVRNGLMRKRIKNYKKKIAIYKWKLLFGICKHNYVDGNNKILSKLDLKVLWGYYFRSFIDLRINNKVKRIKNMIKAVIKN